jgi:hypothetical protein
MERSKTEDQLRDLGAARAELHGKSVELAGRSQVAEMSRGSLDGALLSIDLFPRCAVVLAVLERISGQDSAIFLNADRELVIAARTFGPAESVRTMAPGSAARSEASHSGSGLEFEPRREYRV